LVALTSVRLCTSSCGAVVLQVPVDSQTPRVTQTPPVHCCDAAHCALPLQMQRQLRPGPGTSVQLLLRQRLSSPRQSTTGGVAVLQVKPVPQSALVAHEQRKLSPPPGVSTQAPPAPHRPTLSAQSTSFAAPQTPVVQSALPAH